RVPTIDQSLEWQSAFNPKISPDGKRVVYEVQKTNWEENAFERNLWIGDVASGETHALTTAKKSSTNPEWSPDGKWIAFLSDRPAQIAGTPEGKKQLYVISSRSEEHTSELQSRGHLVCRLLLEKKKKTKMTMNIYI